MNFDIVYIKASQASVLLPVIAGWMYYKKLDRPFRVLFFFLIASVVFEIQSYIAKVKFGNNLPGLHLFTFVEMLTMSYIYYSYFSRSKIMMLAISLNATIFTIVSVADAFFINDLLHHNTLSRPYASISIVIYALVYFYSLIKNDFEYYSWQYPMFWVSISVMIYFALNTFNFMLDNYFIKYTNNITNVSLYTHAFFNIVANCLFVQSFRCFKIFKTK